MLVLITKEPATQAAEYLLEKGYKQLAYVSGDAGSMTSDKRWLGFSETAKAHEAASPIFINAKYSFEAGLEAAKALLEHTSKPDAVFCANDILAMGVIDGLRQLGCNIPQDFAIMGVDDIPMASWPSYDLTTIAQPVDKIVQSAVEDLMQRINDNVDAKGEYLLESGTIIERGSTQIN